MRAAVFLRAAEMAARYAVDKSTFLRWYREGRVPAALRVGQVLRFDPVVVDKALGVNSEKLQVTSDK